MNTADFPNASESFKRANPHLFPSPTGPLVLMSEAIGRAQREIGHGGIQDEIDEWLKTFGNRAAWIRQRTDKPTTTTEGTPDFIGCINGKVFAVEVKQPDKKPTAAQQAQLCRWKSAGAITAIVHSLEEFKSAVAVTFAESKQPEAINEAARVKRTLSDVIPALERASGLKADNFRKTSGNLLTGDEIAALWMARSILEAPNDQADLPAGRNSKNV